MKVLAPDLLAPPPAARSIAPAPAAEAAGGRPAMPFDFLDADAWRALARQARGDTEESARAMATIARHFRETALVHQFERVMRAKGVLEDDPLWLWLELFSIGYSTQNSTVGVHCEALGKNTRALSSLSELNGRYATLMASCLADVERISHATATRLNAVEHLLQAVGEIVGDMKNLRDGAGPRVLTVSRGAVLWAAISTALLIVTLGALVLRGAA